MYFALQYLSLSDAVVLKFLAPILTGFSGVIFLKESLSLKQVAAGREHFMKCLTSIAIHVIQYAVFVELS
jgi:threonine/homoserine efflux transporter RhtA